MLLPVFNGSATLARALDSSCGQTWRDWELIAIDDGSTDETSSILQGAAQKEPRIRVIRRRHEGLVAALNAGLAAARGEFIARMDADDEAHPERLAEQVAFLSDAANRDIGVVGCLVDFGGDAQASAGYALHVAWLNSIVTREAVALNRFIESPLAHPSVMFRRALLAQHGGYRAGDFPEDYELWLRWLEAGVKMAKVPRVLLRWNDAPGRLSRADARYSPEAFFRLKAGWIAKEAGRLLRGRALVVWGAGRPTRKRAAQLEQHGVRIGAYIDVDVKKIGRAVAGVPVMAPDEARPEKSFVLGYVSTRGARELIREALGARGFIEGRDFLMCA
ncbi:MAG TPA: glycosyltransferase [Opitutaceae bacterium]|nr:glycosyltransferase [Opitutaceae bacterium]